MKGFCPVCESDLIVDFIRDGAGPRYHCNCCGSEFPERAWRDYHARNQIVVLAEIRRNIDNALALIPAQSFDHAALDLEVAASKLRSL